MASTVLRWAIALVVLLSTTRVAALDESLGMDQVFVNAAKANSWRNIVGGPFTPAKSYAVVVAISQYDHFSAISSASADAAKVRDFLLKVAGFDTVHVLTERKVSRFRLKKLMEETIPSQIREGDQLLFYWSGHGVGVAQQGGGKRGYLPLADSRPTNFANMIDMEAFSQWDRLLPAKSQALFLLDSCLAGLAGVERKGDAKLAELRGAAHTLVTASNPEQNAIAGSLWNGSLFTTAFIDGASGKAGRVGSPIVSVTEVMAYVQNRIADEYASGRAKNMMSPGMSQFAQQLGDFYFVTGKASALAMSSTALPTKEVKNPAVPDKSKGDDATSFTVANEPAATERLERIEYAPYSKIDGPDITVRAENAFAPLPTKGSFLVAASSKNVNMRTRSDIALYSTAYPTEERRFGTGVVDVKSLDVDPSEQFVLVHGNTGCGMIDLKRGDKVKLPDFDRCELSKSRPGEVIGETSARFQGDSLSSPAIWSFDSASGKQTFWLGSKGFRLAGQTESGIFLVKKKKTTAEFPYEILETEFWLVDRNSRRMYKKLWAGNGAADVSIGASTVAVRSGSLVEVLSLTGVTVKRLTIDSPGLIAMSPNDRHVAVLSSGRLSVIDVETGVANDLPIPQHKLMRAAPIWNPTGTAVLFDNGLRAGVFILSSRRLASLEEAFHPGSVFSTNEPTLWTPTAIYRIPKF